MLSDLHLLDVASAADKAVCRYICAALSIRATQFISACERLCVLRLIISLVPIWASERPQTCDLYTGLASLLNHMKRPECTIAIDGSLYRYHPRLHDMMTAKIRQLAPDTKVTFTTPLTNSSFHDLFKVCTTVSLSPPEQTDFGGGRKRTRSSVCRDRRSQAVETMSRFSLFPSECLIARTF